MGFSFHFFKLTSCPIHWIVCVLAYLNFRAVLVLPKTTGSAQTHKSMSFIWIVWSTLYEYLWVAFICCCYFKIMTILMFCTISWFIKIWKKSELFLINLIQIYASNFNPTGYSCNKIIRTWIQIFHQNWFGFFCNISQQMMI